VQGRKERKAHFVFILVLAYRNAVLRLLFLVQRYFASCRTCTPGQSGQEITLKWPFKEPCYTKNSKDKKSSCFKIVHRHIGSH